MPRKSLNMAARWTGFGLALVVTILIAILTNREGYKKREYREVAGYEKWDESVVETARRIPVQLLKEADIVGEAGKLVQLDATARVGVVSLHDGGCLACARLQP